MQSNIGRFGLHVVIVLVLIAAGLFIFSRFGGVEIAGNDLVIRAQDGTEAVLHRPAPSVPGPAPWEDDWLSTTEGPRNVIVFIGDGMGLGHVSAASALLDGPGTVLAMMDTPHVGLMRTWAANDLATDSAASGTAMATGFKTNIKKVGVLPDGRPVRNLFEAVRSRGLSTGVVTTSGLVDATPASFTIHAENRDHYEVILERMLDSETDLMFGGDWCEWHKARRNQRYMELAADIENLGSQRGYAVTRDPSMVKSATLPVLGLFPPRPADKEAHGPHLTVSTRRAIELLAADPDGFLLVVECEITDSLAHHNNIEGTLAGIREFDEAVAVALEFSRGRDDTLVLVTADHDTGTLALTGGEYEEGQATVRWASGDHSSQWVPFFAFGPGAELFGGVFDNTWMPQWIARMLGLSGFPAVAENR